MKKVIQQIAFAAASLSAAAALAAGNPNVEHQTQGFLEALAGGGGKPIEQMTPTEARAVLAGAQAGGKTALPRANIGEKTLPRTA